MFTGDVGDYRIVQTENGSLEVYWNQGNDMRDKFLSELKKMSEDRGFIIPAVEFYDYSLTAKRNQRKTAL